MSLGGGTHFEEPDFIGKFGFGLPNASINQTKRVEVYSKVDTATNEQNLPYVGLEHIESNSGFYLGGEEASDFGTANIFKRGQVLFPKLRPYLNKVFHATFDGVCSTEFHVLDGFKVTNEFLACFLRTNIVVAQTKRLMLLRQDRAR